MKEVFVCNSHEECFVVYRGGDCPLCEISRPDFLIERIASLIEKLQDAVKVAKKEGKGEVEG